MDYHKHRLLVHTICPHGQDGFEREKGQLWYSRTALLHVRGKGVACLRIAVSSQCLDFE